MEKAPIKQWSEGSSTADQQGIGVCAQTLHARVHAKSVVRPCSKFQNGYHGEGRLICHGKKHNE
eukprot:1149498-Pelagomonas_calceolata.AAC.10